MSSLWTPGGERPVRQEATPQPAPEKPDLSPEEMEAQMRALQQRLAETPASEVVANHCFGLFELAALHLGLQPPQLAEASVAIDALAALVDKMVGRLGQNEAQLNEGLASLRLAFVQIRAQLGQPEPVPSDERA